MTNENSDDKTPEKATNDTFEDTTFEDLPNDNAELEKMTTTNMNGCTASAQTPMAVLSFAFACFLGFQTWCLITDHNALTKAYIDQGKTLEQIEKVKAQLGALMKGTDSLASKGNKNALEIVDQLKKAGVTFQDRPAAPAPQPESMP